MRLFRVKSIQASCERKCENPAIHDRKSSTQISQANYPLSSSVIIFSLRISDISGRGALRLVRLVDEPVIPGC
ncbi:hypothetical protein SCP_1603080 [Sparassis crispa]|uniref:Uncharacterized protein n=1 Tax=Sparassis crispa TaxID=139825 RepID=A0A401H5F2_9APHY|nr:hypothetical protein SCP_1603080 [Sparassis crispa]GBE89644.1 hypothetical protein SCP_1603080 [Sparassis crispa]